MKRCKFAVSKGRFSRRPRISIWAGLAIALLLLLPQVALAELSSTVTGSTLTVISDGADAVVLSCEDGAVQVNASNPDSGVAECAAMTSLQIEGGPGANIIDASAVHRKEFPALTEVTLVGGEGNDVITGTAVVDTISGGPGHDQLIGLAGNDVVEGGAGNDHLRWNNGDGSDRFEGEAGYDTIHVTGTAGQGDAFTAAPNGARFVVMRTNLVTFTLNIGTAEQLVMEQGDRADTIQVTSLAQTQVIVSSAGNPEVSQPKPMVIVGTGNISNTVAAYQLLLGGENNGGEPGSQPAGYRSINWDGIPDEQAAPHDYPSDFFNAPTAPRARGAILTTPGTGLQVSADSENADGALPRFGHINPSYVDSFTVFSAERLFSPVGSNIADLTFFVPGTDTPAVTRGFGAIYTDIDTTHTAFEYFDINGNSLGEYQAPIAQEGLSFLGIIFPEPLVHRVRIRYGTDALGPDDGDGVDVAVMDDFIYGEPQPVD